MSDVRTRIPPSPTGEDLHIGNVYTALLNFVFARKNSGAFIIRIEDTDRTRLVEGSEQKILESLKWFGLTYDEGPDIGGPYAPYRQSERLPLYKKHAEQLVSEGHAYYCFCTPQRLAAVRAEQQAKKQPTLYDGFCKKYSQRESREKAKNEKFVIRLNVPDEGTISFTDVIRGEISFENRLIDDQVLLKSDGFPTYHLGVVVDDHLMHISHVIRGEEWISSVPKHLHLYKFFNWELPVFAHGPILRNPDKSKLSKRKNPVWASWYKEQGYLPEAVLNYLALMGWSMPPSAKASTGKTAVVDIFTLDDMMKHFRLEDVNPVGPVFDIKKLDWMNGEYIRRSQNSKIKSQIFEFLNRKYPEEIIEKTVPLIKERIKKFSEYLPLCEFFYSRPEKYEIDLLSKLVQLDNLVKSIKRMEDWTADTLGKTMGDLVEKEGYKPSDFFMTVRVAVTGRKISPPLNESMELLGKEEVITRLHNACR